MPDEKEEKPNYEVGYRKPPKKTQFPKGQSGNPSGRPKKQKTVSELFKEVGNQKVKVTESGKQIKITRNLVVVKQLYQKAIQGDARAWREVFGMDRLAQESEMPTEDVTRERSTKEGMIQTFMAMMADMSKKEPLHAAEIENDEEEDECSNIIK